MATKLDHSLDEYLLKLNYYLQNKAYAGVLESFSFIFQHLGTPDLEFLLDRNFIDCLEKLVTETNAMMQSATVDSDIVSCLTLGFRICRNSCAKFCDNQTILRQEQRFLRLVRDLLVKLGSCDCLSEDLLVLTRCAIQFIGNIAAGNQENQVMVVGSFFQAFSSLLHIPDEALQRYICIVIHSCLSGCLSNLEAKQRLMDSAGCWSVLLSVIKLSVDKECPWGLYVIEDACMFPNFCDNVCKDLTAKERILVLEVLSNHLKCLTGDENSDSDPVKIPHVSNIQHISEHYKNGAAQILNMHGGDHEDLESMVIVKELECLSLATALHRSYGSLQEDTALLKCCIGLLQKIDEIGRQGNNVFSSVEKISRQEEIDPHHPVFGLKRDLIRLIGNMGYRHKQNQDLNFLDPEMSRKSLSTRNKGQKILWIPFVNNTFVNLTFRNYHQSIGRTVRELQGLPLIMDQTNIDGKNPFITQWSVFAIHNLVEDNDANKQFIAELKMQGVANNQTVLEDYGLEVKTDGEKVTVKKLKVDR